MGHKAETLLAVWKRAFWEAEEGQKLSFRRLGLPVKYTRRCNISVGALERFLGFRKRHLQTRMEYRDETRQARRAELYGCWPQTQHGVHFKSSVTYFVSVRAYNRLGVVSKIVHSDGITVDTSAQPCSTATRLSRRTLSKIRRWKKMVQRQPQQQPQQRPQRRPSFSLPRLRTMRRT